MSGAMADREEYAMQPRPPALAQPSSDGNRPNGVHNRGPIHEHALDYLQVPGSEGDASSSRNVGFALPPDPNKQVR